MNGLAAAMIGAFTSTAGGRGGGPALLFSGMFAGPGRSDWPSGVQEADAPRFALDHAASLRPGGPLATTIQPPIAAAEDDVAGDIVDLFNRPLEFVDPKLAALGGQRASGARTMPVWPTHR